MTTIYCTVTRAGKYSDGPHRPHSLKLHNSFIYYDTFFCSRYTKQVSQKVPKTIITANWSRMKAAMVSSLQNADSNPSLEII